MNEYIYKDVVKKLDAEIEIQENIVTSGSVSDFPRYRKVTGLIEGLRVARKILDDAKKRFMEDDDYS